MAIVRKSPLIQSVLFASVIALVGCGGGGGSNPPSSSSAASSQLTTISSSVDSSIVSSSSQSATTSASADSISSSSSSQSITLSSSSQSSTLEGSSSSSSVITTSSVAPQDTTPNSFSFSNSTNAELNAIVTSPAVTISGINAATAISIVGGEYSINGGAFTSAAGTISNGQTLSLRVTASDNTNTATDVTVTVGGVSATFSVTTFADVTADAFAFTDKTDAEVSTEYTSNTITLDGIDIAVPVSISGGEYSINGGAFTSAAGTISNGQTLSLRVTASEKTNTSKDVTVTVGEVSATFTVTTLADVTPDAFAFTEKLDAELDTEYTSNAITVTGIDVAVPVSVAGGEYAIDGGVFTSAAGSVSPGQTIAVKTTSGASTEITTTVALTLGGVTGTFSITTPDDTSAPVAEFKFPTPYTMSEANEVKVRGVATDDHAITNVKLVVRSFAIDTPESTLSTTEITATPKSETDGVKDFSTWTASIPLTADAENEIKVIALDDRDNETVIEQANKVVIRQADVSSAFPDEVNQFNSIFQGLVIDSFGGRERVLIGDSDSVISVDLKTGIRQKIISSNDGIYSLVLDPSGELLYVSSSTEILEFDLISGLLHNRYGSSLLVNAKAMAMEFNGSNGQNLVLVNSVYSDTSGGDVIGFSLAEKEFYTISSNANEPFLMMAEGISVDRANNRYLIPVGGQFDLSLHGVVAVDRDTGLHSMFSNNAVAGGELFGEIYGSDSAIITAIVDQSSNSLLVPEYPNKLFSIDLESGYRKILANLSYKNTMAVPDSDSSLGAMDIDNESRVLYVIESLKKSLLAIDLETGEKVILSKSKNDF